MTTELIANSPVPGTQTAITTLAAAQTSTTSLTFTMAAAAPSALQGVSGDQFRTVIDSEIIIFDASQVSTTTWTALVRGAESSTAATHASGVSVYHDLTAGALENLISPQVQGAIGTALGATQTVSFNSVVGMIWLVGTLSANLAITVQNWVAGCVLYVGVVQGAAGNYSVTVNSTAVPINTTAGQFSAALIYGPDATDLLVTPLSVPGPTGPAGAAGATGATGAAGAGFGPPTTETTNYTVVASDNGKVLVFNGASLTATLPSSAPAVPWAITIINENATGLTVSANGLTLNGSASAVALAQDQGIVVVSSGTAYYYYAGLPGPAGPSGGGLVPVVVSAAYIATAGEAVVADGAFAVTLPSAPASGTQNGVIALSGTATVIAGGTDTISFLGASYTLLPVPQGASIALIYDSGKWYCLTVPLAIPPIDLPTSPSTGYDYEFLNPGSAVPAGWAWVNQGGATYQEAPKYGAITIPTNAGDSFRMLVQTPPAAPFTLTAKMRWFSGEANYSNGGIILYDGTHVVSFGVIANTQQFGAYVYSAVTGGGATNIGLVNAINPAINGELYWDYYSQVVYHSATDIDFNLSFDSLHWTALYTGWNPGSAFGAVTGIGFGGDNNGTGNNIVVSCEWFRVR